jgi:hypothetical protein
MSALDDARRENSRLRAINADLLDALEKMVDAFRRGPGAWRTRALRTADDAIAKARRLG